MYLYLLECKIRKNKSGLKSNPLKIGVTDNIENRVKKLQTGCPFPLNVICMVTIESKSEAFKRESDLLFKLRNERMMGEWFKPQIRRSKLIIELLQEAQEELLREDKTKISINDLKIMNSMRIQGL